MLDPKQIVKASKPVMVTPEIPTEYSIRQSFLTEIQKISKMNDEELYNFQRQYIHFILSGNEVDIVTSLFRNSRFVVIFTNALKGESITGEESIICNGYLYNLFSEANKYMKDLYLGLAEVNNGFRKDLFTEMGFPDTIAVCLAMCCWSSLNVSDSIKRVNDFITYNISAGFATVQKIIDVYSALYRNNLTDLVLTNTFDIRFKNKIPANKFDSDMLQIEENIKTATLFILESVPVDKIVEILLFISEDYFNAHNRNGRFARIKYHHLPTGIHKIPTLVEHLENTEDNFKVP